MDQFSSLFGENIFFPLKTSSDRLKLTYKTKKKKKKIDVKARTTVQERGSCRRNYLLKLVKLCQYNSQIHRVPAGRIVTNKQTNILAV
jgi:hypothetical protein